MSGDEGTLWASLPLPAFLLDAHDRIERVNPAAETFLNASARSLRGAPIWDMVMVDAPLEQAFARIREAQAPLTINDVDVGGGERPPVQCNLQIAPLEEGPGDRVLLLISPRELAHRVGASKSAGTAARSAIGMAAMIAHEIKNPLAGITGAAQLLSMRLGAEDREMTDLIVAESRRIVALLEQVEQFGNLRPPALSPVNLHDVLERARRSAAVGFGAHMTFQELYDPSLPPTLADADQLLQVFQNLLRNAAEAQPERGKNPDPNLLRDEPAAPPARRLGRGPAAPGGDRGRRAGAQARDRRARLRALRLGPRERHGARPRARLQDRDRARRLAQRGQRARAHRVPRLAAHGAPGPGARRRRARGRDDREGELMDGTILVADDDRTIRTVLTQALTRAGCKVHATSSLTTLMRWVGEGKGDLIVTDVVMPDGNGLEMIPKISQERPGLPVIVISAQNTIMTAIQAAEAEAYDYLPKPFDLPDLMRRASRALDVRRRTAPPAPRDDRPEPSDDLPLVGRTPAMQALYRLVPRVMNADLPVLVTGESGTGKSLIARAIHDFGDRRTLPFVTATGIDLATMDGPAAVIARAKGGSILFDEVGDLSLEAQSRIVRMLDSFADGRSASPRVLATSQADLSARMEQGAFRRDLFYRLGGVTIHLPSLRERVDDVPLLVEHFLARAEREGATPRRVSSAAMEVARAYTWPGNVRQLENAVRRLVVMGGEEEIGRAELESVLGQQPAAEPLAGGPEEGELGAQVAKHLRRYFDLHAGALPPPGLYQRVLREMELPLIEIALDETAGNQARCADLLGINRNTLRKKITDLDIQVTRRRKLM